MIFSPKHKISRDFGGYSPLSSKNSLGETAPKNIPDSGEGMPLLSQFLKRTPTPFSKLKALPLSNNKQFLSKVMCLVRFFKKVQILWFLERFVCKYASLEENFPSPEIFDWGISGTSLPKHGAEGAVL